MIPVQGRAPLGFASHLCHMEHKRALTVPCGPVVPQLQSGRSYGQLLAPKGAAHCARWPLTLNTGYKWVTLAMRDGPAAKEVLEAGAGGEWGGCRSGAQGVWNVTDGERPGRQPPRPFG